MLKSEFREWLDKYSDDKAVSYLENKEKKSVTYSEFAKDIINYARGYSLIKEKQIALIGENSYKWFLSFYGGLLAGKNMVLIDMLLPLEELETVIGNIGIERVVLSSEMGDLADDIGKFTKNVPCTMWDTIECESADESDYDWLCHHENEDDGMIFALTSGTTGKAKAVMIKTDAFLYNNRYLASILEGDRGERVYSSLPMHHMYGINKTFAFWHKGLELCLGSMRTIIKDLKAFNPKFILTVPTVVEFLDKKKGLVPSIDTIIVSGCKCEKKTQYLCDEYGIFLQNIYGSSETAGGMALNLRGDDVDVLTVIPGRDVIIDDGEIVIKTVGTMTGYYNNEAETLEKFHDGCIFTGDMGYIDDDNKLHINGRKKDMISMANGDKLYCEETDELLSALQGIAEAAVIYVERKLIAVCVPDKGVSDDEVYASIESYNNNQQMIRRMNEVWILKGALPRTSTGKMQRMVLEKMYLEKKGV